MRLLLKLASFLVFACLVVVAGVLAWGHIHIRRIDPPLPTLVAVLESDRSADLPISLTYINTARQEVPRTAVLEESLDPDPDAAYTMSHPAFVVEWQDGRIFLIDLGMDAAGAMAFGRPLESFAGAGRMQPEKSASEALGEARARVAGIGFTHMHVDHTGGLKSLCEDWRLDAPTSNPIPTFQGRYQMMEVNHTTRSAKVQLENASCIQRQPLVGDDSIQAIPEFPGLFVIAAAGHTPGSQVFVVQLRKRAGASEEEPDDVETWVLTGDIVNHIAGVELDIPKPRLYSLLLVPENEERLHRMRRFLKQLSRQPDVQLLVSHDLDQIETSGLPAYGSAVPAATEALEDFEQ